MNIIDKTDTTPPDNTDQNTSLAPLQPTILVIFGITGDLSRRYLMPSLYHLFKQGLLHEMTEIVGISRRDINLDEVFDNVEMCISEDENVCDPVVMAHLHSRTRVHQLDMADEAGYKDLLQLLNGIEEETGVCMNRLYYLAIPPLAYNQVIEHMGTAGLNASCQHNQAMTRLLVEKPFGHDLASAEALIADTGKVFNEEQLFRIDHYLAKETAQNILAFRFANPLFEAVWHNGLVTGIDIVASEKIGIEGRANFYEEQGALRDFIQNHLLQLLAIVTMDKPERMDSDGVHAAKIQLMRAIQPITGDQVATQSSRGQYQGYRQEVKNEASFVETYAFIQTTIDTPRWKDVPVTVRTGKAMAEKHTTITITFAEDSTPEVNNLRFRIQPNEGIQIGLRAKKPGYDQALQPVTMDFSYHSTFDGDEPTAYERVLVDAVRGDRSLFASSDEVLAAWRVVDEVVKDWTANGDGLVSYQPGTAINELSETIGEHGL
jgi:glucose-6-phosphate 1-dehydrogenase